MPALDSLIKAYSCSRHLFDPRIKLFVTRSWPLACHRCLAVAWVRALRQSLSRPSSVLVADTQDSISSRGRDVGRDETAGLSCTFSSFGFSHIRSICLKVGEPARPAISPIRIDGSDIGPEDQDPSGTRPHARKCQGISRVDFTQNPTSNLEGVLTNCINIIMLLSTSPTFAGAKLRLRLLCVIAVFGQA